MDALIFDIKRFAIHDGPGIRTTIFFKGCPLSCDWCHNPESRSCFIESYIQEDRVGERVFTHDKKIGKYYNVHALLTEIEKDVVFYNESGGGITCSGGEPLYQPEFLLTFLKECKKNNIHTAVDTSGYAPWMVFESILHFTDLFLFDIKHLKNDAHRSMTGVDNSLILDNLEQLIKRNARVQIRYPLVTGVNDDDAYVLELKNFINERLGGKIDALNILPYHDLGKSKYKKFNVKKGKNYSQPDSKRIQQIVEELASDAFEVTIGG